MFSKSFYDLLLVKFETYLTISFRNQCVTHKLLLVEIEIMFNKYFRNHGATHSQLNIVLVSKIPPCLEKFIFYP